MRLLMINKFLHRNGGSETYEIDMYESDDEYCPMEDLEYLEFKVAVLDGDSYDEICISDPVTISFE